MNLNMNVNEKRDAGFTLLELLIVISIIAILSVALVVVLDPAEALRKARDAQRISDTNTMKTALGLYLTSTTTPILGAATAGAITNTYCKETPATAWGGSTRILYSLTGAAAISDVNLDGAASAVTVANPSLTDGNGWIPVMFDNLTGGSPISNIPLDPTNTVAAPATVTSADLVYRYGCSLLPLAFEIDAQLESAAYTSIDDKRAKDGGNGTGYYEVGTNLKILGSSGTNVVDF